MPKFLYMDGFGNDANTISLLDFVGADGSTTFTDIAAGASRTWTAFGNAQIDTAIQMAGLPTGLFDGTGDYITTPDSADLAFGLGPFTFDFRIKRAETGTAQHNVFGHANAGLTGGYHLGFIKPTTSVFEFGMNDQTKNASTATGITNTNEHHIAVVRDGNNLGAALDGVWGTLVDVTGITYTDSPGAFAWGRGGDFATGSLHNGSLGQCRISNIARWTPGVNFTPPAGPYS